MKAYTVGYRRPRPRTAWRTVWGTTLRIFWLFCLPMLFSLNAAGQEATTDDRRGVASTMLECLAVGDPNVPKAGEVELRWSGEAERARLMLSVSGADAPHSVLINGQAAAVAPIYADGSDLCAKGEVFYLTVPLDLLVQGRNTIELTSDGQAEDQWSASDVRIEVIGQVRAPEETRGPGEEEIIAPEATLTTQTYTNSHDNSVQESRVQVPTGYDPSSPAPLLIVVHPRSADMYYGENHEFHTAADSKGWLYAAPQLHGRWPGTSGAPIPDPPGKFAYAGLNPQYDVVDLIQYMVDTYAVDTNRIYLFGSSMGSHLGEVVVGKHPDLFAAAYFAKGPSDWVEWYWVTDDLVNAGYEQQRSHRYWMRRECYLLQDGSPQPRPPTHNPFCYERGSGARFARNYIHVPIHMLHSVDDILVPVFFSRNLRDAINGSNPDVAAGLVEDTVVGPTCKDSLNGPTSYYHCIEADPQTVTNFLAQYTRATNVSRVSAITDESKTFYWLTVDLMGEDRWSSIEANADKANQTVTIDISDSEPVRLGLNVGATALPNVISQNGLDLGATTYLVTEQGKAPVLVNYNGGYLEASFTSTGAYRVTVSALDVAVVATPAERAAGQAADSTIQVTAKDKLNNLAPNGTEVVLTTTAGTFPNGDTTFTGQIANGQLSVVLSLDASDGTAQVTAAVGDATGSATILVTGDPPTPTPPTPTPPTPTPPTPTPPTPTPPTPTPPTPTPPTPTPPTPTPPTPTPTPPTPTPTPPTPTPTPSTPTPDDTGIYLSTDVNGEIDGLSYMNEDILVYNMTTGEWSIIFDGSDVGLGKAVINAFAIEWDEDGNVESILLSLAQDQFNFQGFGTVDDSDILRFTPTSLGAMTAGSFTWFFDGSDVDMTTGSEDIDGLSLLPDGRLVISTVGVLNVPGLKAQNEDMVLFTPTQTGETTSGSWSLYFDGSDVQLGDVSSEDIGGTWIQGNGEAIYVTTLGDYSVPNASGDNNDIVRCTPGSVGDATACSFDMFWDGAAAGFDATINAFEIGSAPQGMLTTFDASDKDDPVEVDDPDDLHLDQWLFLPFVGND